MIDDLFDKKEMVMSSKQVVFVVGHMGTGKFLFSEALAEKLQWNLVDANPSIERYIGRSTRDILGEAGMQTFNKSQADIIKYYADKQKVVVLLEECAVEDAYCRELLKDAQVVYLNVDIPTQLGRMQHGRTPALPVENMQQQLEVQHQARDQHFESVASVTIESQGAPDNEADTQAIIDRDVNAVINQLNL